MRTIPDPVLADARALRQTLIDIGRRRSLRDPIFATCEALELTPPQFHSLLWLGHDGPLAMRELARLLGISDKTVTGVVDRLERRGYVQRLRDAADRRVIRVKLTRKGVATWKKLDAQIEAGITLVLGLLSAEDRRDLMRIFTNLGERVGQMRDAKLKAVAQ